MHVSGVELPSAAKEVYEVLKRAMKPLWLVYDVTFLELLEVVEQSIGDLF